MSFSAREVGKPFYSPILVFMKNPLYVVRERKRQCKMRSRSTRRQIADQLAEWAAEEEELLPSLLAPFGRRDAVTAVVADADPPAHPADLRVRAWTESVGCTHVVVVNTSPATPARFELQLRGSLALPITAQTAELLFRA